MDKNWNSYFAEEKSQSKETKRCAMFVIREVQLEIMSHQSLFCRLANTEMSNHIKCCQKCESKEILAHCCWEYNSKPNSSLLEHAVACCHPLGHFPSTSEEQVDPGHTFSSLIIFFFQILENTHKSSFNDRVDYAMEIDERKCIN